MLSRLFGKGFVTDGANWFPRTACNLGGGDGKVPRQLTYPVYDIIHHLDPSAKDCTQPILQVAVLRRAEHMAVLLTQFHLLPA